jgi:hypothetical protein
MIHDSKLFRPVGPPSNLSVGDALSLVNPEEELIWNKPNLKQQLLYLIEA